VIAMDTARPDHRSTAEHLATIREVLKPTMTALAKAFNVSRQEVYRWVRGESIPGERESAGIRSLSLAADAFHAAGLSRPEVLLGMKAFDGRSMLDLVSAGQLSGEHAQLLIAEARAMDAGYNRSGLATSKAEPSNDWRAELSIPSCWE